MKNTRYLFLFFIISSCSSLYIPTTINTPLIKEKGDAQVELSASTNSGLIATNFAFSNKFALMSSFGMSYGNFSNKYDIFTDKKEPYTGTLINYDQGRFLHKYGEIGFGRFNILNNKQETKKPIQLLEVFAGIGYGEANDKEVISYVPIDDSIYNYSVNYYSYFIQGNYGISNKYFDLGVALKLSISYFDYSYEDFIRTDNSIGYEKIKDNISFNMLHVEPMFFVRGGIQNLKFKWQAGVVLNQKNQSRNQYSIYGFDEGIANITWLHMSIGLSYTFNFLQKNKN